jgi:hypothetical protein
MKDVFTDIYVNNKWVYKPEYPKSGFGSMKENAKNLSDQLPELFAEFQIKSVLDAGCGDMTWMSELLLDLDISYHGVDIVDELIAVNQNTYPEYNFSVCDISQDPLPKADIMICRDCLFHMSLKNIAKTLKNFVNSDIKYLLTTNIENTEKLLSTERGSKFCINNNAQDGDWCLLDLRADPFGLTSDVRKKLFDFTELTVVHRYMCLWDKQQVIDAITKWEDNDNT